MIEKIGAPHYEKLSEPNKHFLMCICKKKREKKNLTIAEIGIGIGATIIEANKMLDSCDKYYLFDYSDKIEQLKEDIKIFNHRNVEYVCLGNSRFLKDSYVWSLFDIMQSQPIESTGVFDIVLLDGAHDLTIDLGTSALLVNMLKNEGVIIVDDVNLTINDIIAHNTLTTEKFICDYPKEYFNKPQMKMICDAFFDRCNLLKEIKTDTPEIRVYKKYNLVTEL